MKKIYIILFGILLIGTVFAVSFASREEMINYFRTYKQERESSIKNTISTITYTTNKDCMIEYYTEEIYCEICFEYTVTLNKKIKVEECIHLDEDSTIEEDDETVRQYVRESVNDIIPIEEIKYKARDMKGRQINLK